MKKIKRFYGLSLKFPRPPNDILSAYIRFDGTKEFLKSDTESQIKGGVCNTGLYSTFEAFNFLLRPACICI